MKDYYYDFSGKTAIVTGGSRGIGEQLVYDLAEANCNVIFTYSTNESKAKKIRDHICSKKTTSVNCIKVDFTNDDDIKRFIEYTNKLKKINFLVNNAGLVLDKPIQLLSNNDWSKVLSVNLTGAFKITQSLTRKLAVSKGSIVNVSSISGIMGNPGQSNYSASKAGLIGFTKTISKELGPMGVRVNSIAPGYIHTKMTQELDEQTLIKNIPLRRVGLTKEVSSCIMFLLSSASSYITGKVIVPDGGIL